MTPATISRRALLGAGTGLAVASLSGCGSSPGGTPAATGLRWWDHYSALQKFHKDWSAAQADVLGTGVEYTYIEASKSAQALQLANQSKQLPDVYSNTLGLPLSALINEKWVRELTLSDAAVATLPKGSFTEGITNAEGKVYGLPLFSFRQYSTATWFNTEILTKAGVDPANPPTSYDEFRAACAKIKSAGGGAAMTLALGDPGRMRDQIDDMAQAGGFPGHQGLKFTDGSYAYDHDAYLNAIELWKELSATGMLIQGAASFTVAQSRTRWASGAAGFFPDGPWCAGGVKVIMPDFVSTMGVGPLLSPEAGAEYNTYRGAPGSQFFVAGTSTDPERASRLIESFTNPDYQKGLAAGMDQPPIDLAVVDTADVTEPYRTVVGYFKTTVKRAPQALIKNPDIAQVQAASKPVTPHLGNLVQGYLGGDVTDLKGELKKLSDAFSRDREQAIAAAKAKGAKVSTDDYVFSDWKPGVDYAVRS